MNKSLLDTLLCPACSGPLQLTDAALVTVSYEDGAREEVESGMAVCGCGRAYPIEDFVLSLSALFPADLQQEAAYWDRYYGWLLDQGSLGFHDLRLGQAPYITQGVPDPFPCADTLDRYTVHHEVAEHPLMRRGNSLLDVGVGLGWTSLYFARAGYRVTAFEPSMGPVRAAKRYAIAQGVFVEYVCAALGFIAFKPGSFDNVTAFHSLHHVPNLERELGKVREWMVAGGALAIDEHVGNSKLAAALARELHEWADKEVLPQYRTLPPEVMALLPDDPHSALEDSSVTEVMPLVSRMFDVRDSRPRHVFLDHYALLYYLHTGRDVEAYKHALRIADQMQEMVRRADPEGGDYVTLVAEKKSDDWMEPSENEEAAPDSEPVAEEPPVLTPDAAAAEERSAMIEERAVKLERELAAQGEWARGLEEELRRKNAEIARNEAHMKRLEKGRVMRLLRLLRRK